MLNCKSIGISTDIVALQQKLPLCFWNWFIDPNERVAVASWLQCRNTWELPWRREMTLIFNSLEKYSSYEASLSKKPFLVLLPLGVACSWRMFLESCLDKLIRECFLMILIHDFSFHHMRGQKRSCTSVVTQVQKGFLSVLGSSWKYWLCLYNG